MSTITTKVCDRCGAQHVRPPYANEHHVQPVKWVVPTGIVLGQSGENTKELCTPCRKALASLIRKFVTPEGSDK